MNFVLHLIIMISVYVILAESLNLATGYGGMLSLAHAAFFGTGAYAVALLTTRFHVSFFAALPAAMFVSGILALCVGRISLRLRGDFFILATIGFQAIVSTTLQNWLSLTGGPYGISGVAKPEIFGWRISGLGSFAGLASLLACLVCAFFWRLIRSPYGRSLQAVRDDELAAASIGKDVLYFKTSAFVTAGAVAAVAGGIYAAYHSYIDPTSFTLDESIFIFTIVVIGGAGNLKGPAIGAVILVLLPEILRFLQIPDSVAAPMRQMVYGGLLVLMMFLRPRGMAGRYAFD